MDYNLKIGSLALPVSCTQGDDGSLSIQTGGQTRTARYRVVSENQIHLEVDGAAMNVYLADDPSGTIISLRGTSYLVQDADVLARAGTRKRGAKELPQEITPPMPSAVVHVMVTEGDHVEKGQGVVVVSAMKMETTLQAPFAGVVSRVNCAVGDKVMPGQILVDIEKEVQEGQEAG